MQRANFSGYFCTTPQRVGNLGTQLGQRHILSLAGMSYPCLVLLEMQSVPPYPHLSKKKKKGAAVLIFKR